MDTTVRSLFKSKAVWCHLVDCLGNTKQKNSNFTLIIFLSVTQTDFVLILALNISFSLSPVVENIAHCEFAYLRDLLIR